MRKKSERYFTTPSVLERMSNPNTINNTPCNTLSEPPVPPRIVAEVMMSLSGFWIEEYPATLLFILGGYSANCSSGEHHSVFVDFCSAL